MEVLKYDNDFLIDTNYPHQIINRHTNIPLTEYKYDYIQLSIKGKTCHKHRLVALQFIPNSDPSKKYLDHIDGNKHNNTISNLRWVTHSDNMYNRNGFTKQAIQCLDELPENYSEIELLNGIQYEGYYFDHDDKRILKVKQFNKGMRIKIINPTKNKIVLTDIHGKNHTYSYTKLINDLNNY